MLSKTRNELCYCITVALRSLLLKAIHCRERTDLTAQLPFEAARIASQEAAAECIPDSSGVNDLILRYSWDMDRTALHIQIRTILAARDHQDFNVLQDLIEAPARLFGDQSELVI